MVQEMVTMRVQDALVKQLGKRFDGDAYHGGFHNPKFGVDFFANDRTIVTREDVEDFISGFSATYEGTEYDVIIEATPEKGYKYQFILSVQPVDDE